MEEYKVFPISVIFDNHYFYCISYKLDDNLTCDYQSSEIRYFRVDRFQTIHKSENDLAFTLSPEQKDRLITDEQVRYQAFSMLSGNEWARITFEYKGLTVMSWNPIFQNLNYLRKALVMVLIRSVMRLKLLVY